MCVTGAILPLEIIDIFNDVSPKLTEKEICSIILTSLNIDNWGIQFGGSGYGPIFLQKKGGY